MIRTAVIAHYESGKVQFYFEKVTEIDGELYIDDGESNTLVSVDSINTDEWSDEIVEVLNENVPDEDLQEEMSGRLKRRFDFIRHEDPAVIRARHGL